MKVNSMIRYYLAGGEVWGNKETFEQLERVWTEKIHNVFISRRGC